MEIGTQGWLKGRTFELQKSLILDETDEQMKHDTTLFRLSSLGKCGCSQKFRHSGKSLNLPRMSHEGKASMQSCNICFFEIHD